MIRWKYFLSKHYISRTTANAYWLGFVKVMAPYLFSAAWSWSSSDAWSFWAVKKKKKKKTELELLENLFATENVDTIDNWSQLLNEIQRSTGEEGRVRRVGCDYPFLDGQLRKKNKSWLRCHQRSERDIQVKAKHTVTFDVTPLRWWHLRVGAGCERSDWRGVCLCKVSERSWSWKRRELQQKDSGNWRLPWTPAM